ncbi:hypothetical protein MOE70_11725 [Bacillus licheniformis]|uniref:hypothetical protein n=1 Tax=Bacillus licheniformis TaxID=1402 RepID=UPI0022805643|nr:hypothetical protein [Bacillus licheniformis]MCY7774059.1 hypothetical protein [Bacillus licheniformis]MCY8159641.1 hypothetical protein [Bacillus licheniformis]MCY8531148.1 hypothetical protein [Bacillus licheniformis]MCY9284863.1 hypothetical protein [Bacillus licheniformis]MEC1389060.1 hypothetical protein [Bacillus licheniformis]
MTSQLKVIEGTRKPDYYSIYRRMFNKAVIESGRKIQRTNQIETDDFKKIVFFGIKMINHSAGRARSRRSLELKLRLIEFIQTVIGELTPRELMQMFPIRKQYDGKKFGMKDYFSTMQAVKEKGFDNCIGTEEEVFDFLRDYQNPDITLFMVTSVTTVSALRRASGQKSLFEEFADKNDIAIDVMTL